MIDRYARTDLIVASELAADARTPKIGVIKGTITFVDGTRLYFTEYVDGRYRLEKLSYSYHCQDADGKLMFRYDDAAHKPPLPYRYHKHLPDGRTVEATVPDLALLIEEVLELFLP